MKCEFIWYGCRTNDTPDERCQAEAVEAVLFEGKDRNYCRECATRVKADIAAWKKKQREAVVINADGETVTFEEGHTMREGSYSYVQWHQFCGHLDRNKTSNDRESLHCRSCGLRILIPAGLKTREQFLKHFERFNKNG